jgi:stage II sporulation protein D (peptidoglycan lytic transglycosylase)
VAGALVTFVLTLLVLAALGPGPAGAAPDDIRVVLMTHAQSVEIGGGPLAVRDLRGSRVLPTAPAWLRLAVWRRGGLELQFAGARPRAVTVPAVRVVSAGGRPVRVNARDYPGAVEIARAGTGVTVVNALPLEDYLPGVVKAEAGETMPLEMLKAQAVVARTYAAYHRDLNAGKPYHLGADTAHQQYVGAVAPASLARLAVQQTRGQILLWEGALFPAFYHTDSGGHTEDPRVVYDTHRMPALRPVPVGFTSESAHREWTLDLTLADLAARLRRGGVPAGSVVGLEVVERSGSLRVTRIAVRGARDTVVLLGNEFRRLIGYDVLKSTLFDVAVDGGWARFTGRGYGHGIGLDQSRAKTMADLAYQAQDILAYFYPGAVLSALP